MAQKFQEGDPVYVQAQQIWSILSAHAVLCKETKRNGLREGLLGYGDLAELMGKSRKAGINLARQLGIVGRYCLKYDLPPRNVIVVRQDTGTPGTGVIHTQGSSVEEDQRQVLYFPWFTLRTPSVESLKDIWDRADSGSD